MKKRLLKVVLAAGLVGSPLVMFNFDTKASSGVVKLNNNKEINNLPTDKNLHDNNSSEYDFYGTMTLYNQYGTPPSERYYDDYDFHRGYWVKGTLYLISYTQAPNGSYTAVYAGTLFRVS